ncbi:MAG: TniQ family protein [Sedimenticola sp.]
MECNDTNNSVSDAGYASQLVGFLQPSKNESFQGYLLRVSELNGYYKPAIIMNTAGYKGAYTAYFDKDLRNLSHITGQAENVLRQLVYVRGNSMKWQDKDKVTVCHGVSLHPFLIDVRKPKICPTCLAEHGVIRWWWDVVPFVACPDHGTYLINFCPECGRKLNWQRPGILKCQCGFDLSGSQLEKAPDETLALSSLIQSIFAGVDAKGKVGSLVHKDFIGMSPSELGWFICLVGSWGIGRQEDSIARIRNWPLSDHRELVKRASATLLNWPSSFHSFLDQVSEIRNADQMTADLLKQLGNPYRVLMHHFSEGSSDFIRDEIKEWGGLWLRSKERLLVTKELENVSLEGVSNQLGIGIDATRKLAKLGVIKIAVRENQRFRYSVYIPTEESVRKVNEMKADMVGAIHARKILNIGQRTMERLRDEGFFTKNEYALIDGRRNYSFSKRQCIEILERMKEVAKPLGDENSDVSVTSLIEATRFFSWLQASQIINAALDSKIRLFHNPTNKGLRSFYVVRDDIRNLIVEMARGDAKHLVSPKEATNLFGMHIGTLAHLYQSGAISVEERVFAHKTYLLIDKNELEQWLDQNVLAPRIARSMKWRLGKEKEKLAAMGIYPTLERTKKGECRWYSKDKLTSAGVSFFSE